MGIICLLLLIGVTSHHCFGVDFNDINLDQNGDGNIGIVAIDVDNDGNSDIITIARGEEKLIWYRNGGEVTPSFTKYIIDENIEGMYLDCKDLNGDNIPEILCSVPFGEGESGHIYLYTSYTQNGEIGWSRSTITDSFKGVHQLHLIDMDLDGDCDILAAAVVDKQLCWWEWSGSEWIDHLIAENYEAQTIEYCDFNGDGYPDILSGMMSTDVADISIWLSGDDQSYEKITIDSSTYGAHWFQIIDLNGDGKKDIVTAATFSQKIVGWLRGDGSDLTFEKTTLIPNLPYPLHVTVADIDNDDDLDILTNSHGGSNHKLLCYINEGDQYQEHLMKSYFNAAWQMVVFDADNDGLDDIICGGHHFPNPQISADLTLFLNSTSVGVEFEVNSLENSSLIYNYPNPFNPSTEISYNLFNKGEVKLNLYNMSGEMVLSRDLGLVERGNHRYNLIANNLSSGSYICEIVSDRESLQTKITYIK